MALEKAAAHRRPPWVPAAERELAVPLVWCLRRQRKRRQREQATPRGAEWWWRREPRSMRQRVEQMERELQLVQPSHV